MRRGWTNQELFFGAALAVAVCLLGVAIQQVQSQPSAADDWRRTNVGWERAGQWKMFASAQVSMPERDSDKNRDRQAMSLQRLDTHPAVLALLQLVGVLVAVASYPAQGTLQAPAAPALGATVSKSFRASAFGC